MRGAAAGAGAAVAAVAIHAGAGLVPASWQRAGASARLRWLVYLVAGAAAAALFGLFVVLVLLGCGVVELVWRRAGSRRERSGLALHVWPLLAAAAASTGGLFALVWVALKVGALSFGGGFVVIPLMQDSAVHQYHWMSAGQFLSAVALGQVTPGPVTHTVASVGYAAAGLGGGLLAAAVAFAPSFLFVLVGAARFDRLRRSERARAFLAGAGPAAIGAILGSAVPLALALSEPWQAAILAVALVALLLLRRGVVMTLVGSGLAGALLALFGLPLNAS